MRAGDNLPPLREVISRHGLHAKKSFGQHFLLDLNLTRRIARASGPLEGTTIYEVGPGPGGLTRALLAEGARHVVAVEYDQRCLPALTEIEGAYPGRLSVVLADAHSVDEPEVLGPWKLGNEVRVAANLPYNVGTALLVKWLSSPIWPPFWSSLTLMFQREVAERIVAKPSTKTYGRLSVLAQWRSKSRILFDVPRSAFVPPPGVTSAVVRIEPLAEPVAPALLADLEAITSATFGQRRKMLRQSLKQLVDDTEGLVRTAHLDPTARPEQLSVSELAALARALAQMRSGAAKD
jgi:16S rRNA (adenine1518-N6/adenine1519-N6)-dimethyltransferase